VDSRFTCPMYVISSRGAKYVEYAKCLVIIELERFPPLLLLLHFCLRATCDRAESHACPRTHRIECCLDTKLTGKMLLFARWGGDALIVSRGFSNPPFGNIGTRVNCNKRSLHRSALTSTIAQLRSCNRVQHHRHSPVIGTAARIGDRKSNNASRLLKRGARV